MAHLTITDTTGKTWTGDDDGEDPTDEQMANLAELVSDFSDLTGLNIEIDGVRHYFNPAHIVAVGVVR